MSVLESNEENQTVYSSRDSHPEDLENFFSW